MMNLFAEPWRERAIAALGLVGALLLVTAGRGAPSGNPGAVRFDVTVVPSDVDDLDCASDTAVAGHRCAFDAKGAPVEVSRPLRPYVSTGGELLLVSGAFEAPEIVEWLEGTRRNPKRVTLRCRGTWLGRTARVGVRMRRTDAFVTQRDVPAVVAKQCSVKPP